MATKEALWLRKPLSVLGVDGGAVPMGEDKQACQARVNSTRATVRTKHLDVAYCVARDYVVHMEVVFYFLASAELRADRRTKELPSPSLTISCKTIGIGLKLGGPDHARRLRYR